MIQMGSNDQDIQEIIEFPGITLLPLENVLENLEQAEDETDDLEK